MQRRCESVDLRSFSAWGYVPPRATRYHKRDVFVLELPATPRTEMAKSKDNLLGVIGVDVDELVQFVNELADAARAIVGGYFRQPIAVDSKRDATPVTVADRRTERKLRAMIEERFPDHGLVGEEYGTAGGDRSCLWVIDPIDGTRGFITGMPLFGTIIGLLVDGVPVLGVLEMPALAERWIGVSGQPTRLGGVQCCSSACEKLAHASLFATTPAMFSPDERERFEAVSRRATLTRFGADCYAYGLLASGFVDLVVEADMKPHDYLGLVPIVEGAGGVITDWSGAPLGFESPSRVVAAATLALHERALELLAG